MATPSSPLDRLLRLLGFREFVGPSLTAAFQTTGDLMATSLIGTVALGPEATNVPVASRSLTLSINGAPAIPLATSDPITFPVNAGDDYVLTAQDISVGGVPSAPTVISGKAQDTVTPPASATLSVGFAPAPTA